MAHGIQAYLMIGYYMRLFVHGQWFKQEQLFLHCTVGSILIVSRTFS